MEGEREREKEGGREGEGERKKCYKVRCFLLCHVYLIQRTSFLINNGMDEKETISCLCRLY